MAGRRAQALIVYEGILERAPLETRVATVRDLFERVDVYSRKLKAVAVWNMTSRLLGVHPVASARASRRNLTATYVTLTQDRHEDDRAERAG